MSDDKYKICPFCGEEIKVIAVKCRHCKSFLDKVSNPVNRASNVDHMMENKQQFDEISNPSNKVEIGSSKNSKSGCLYIVGSILLFLIGLGAIGSLFDNSSDEVIQTDEIKNEVQEISKPEKSKMSSAEELYNQINIGMTKDNVKAIAGNPSSISHSESNNLKIERWTYESMNEVTVIHFINGTVHTKNQITK